MEEISSPILLEKRAHGLSGPLAGAVAGACGQRPAHALFLGDQNVVAGAENWFAFISWCNRWPGMRFVSALARRKGICGSLPTTLLFRNQGKEDRVLASIGADRTLESLVLEKKCGEKMELLVEEAEGAPILRQILHFGKTLPDGEERLVLSYRYEPESGVLRSVGPNAVCRKKFFERRLAFLGEVKWTERATDFEKLVGHRAADSLTFPANSGILSSALRHLRDPAMGVDFHRVAVYALEFSRCGTPKELPADAALQVCVEPFSIEQTDKGELLHAILVACARQEEINRAKVSLLIRGNLPCSPDKPIEKLHVRDHACMPEGEALSWTFMGEDSLPQFAALNGDCNPLHQIDLVAQAAGFQRKINPGFAILAEIETALRKRFDGAPLSYLSGVLVRPVYPGQTCRLEFVPEEGGFLYQLLQPGKPDKLLVDGKFRLPEEALGSA